ncbi:pathogen-related protein-like isoform X2 [Prunus avium]|uniref:Pathogen-related protein-like isoform X2 n=1 Tax=Prunus avium TaxID=42229 RepID=A0A6P5T1A0_PRUAV|nr:pathogen-related protein-like isoform X2 [Prunus avium]
MSMASSGAEGGDKYRSYLSGEGEKNTKWKFGAPPSYDVVNKLFEEGRTKIWPPGSLEDEVQNLVKTWEMELFHKGNLDDFKTLDPNKYTFSLNGRKGITLEEIGKLGGGYNPLLQTSLPENLRGYKAFTTTFPRGFALEVLQVYSGPPEIVYKFRHWGYMEGPFQGHAPTGELVEVYGMSIFTVDENNKIVKVEFFYDPGQLLGGLLKGEKLGTSSQETASSCPVLKSTG